MGIKMIDGFGDCGVLAILFAILSDWPAIQEKIGQNVYDFICSCEKNFKLKESQTEIF